jgi:replication factor A1
MSVNPDNKKSSPRKSIIDLKAGEEGIHITGRVIETTPPRVIQTRKGPRTISNAIIGDETGRVQATLWGSKAGTLEEGKVVDIQGAWTTSFRGKVQVNIGRSTEVKEVEDSTVPPVEDIPEEEPKAPETTRFKKPQRRFRQSRGIYRRR